MEMLEVWQKTHNCRGEFIPVVTCDQNCPNVAETEADESADPA
jgi:hypothetical protein